MHNPAESYDQMRFLMRRAGFHFPPWDKLTSAERFGWARLAARLPAVEDPGTND